MKTVCLMLVMLAAAACGTTESTSMSMSDGSVAHVVRCKDDWTDCYRAAQQVCGEGGFTEIDRVADGTMSPAGRLERRHGIKGGVDNQVYSESPREEVFGRVVTFRCNSPRREP